MRDESMGVAWCAPQEAHYHVDYIYLRAWGLRYSMVHQHSLYLSGPHTLEFFTKSVTLVGGFLTLLLLRHSAKSLIVQEEHLDT